MYVLVTGAAGFIGAHVCERLLAQGVGVEVGHQVEELSLGRFFWQLMQPAGDAGLLAGLALVADIDLAGGILADQDSGQAGSHAAGLHHRRHVGGDLTLHRLGQFLAVEELRHPMPHPSILAGSESPIEARARTDETARLLTSIPGIGPLNATALTAAIGNAQTFGRGRDLAAWLGLVPKQVTTGGKPKLLGISKRGNGYLRKMLIHGARAALPTLSKGETPLGAWLRGLLARAHVNTVVVALAAKLARIAWAVIRRGEKFNMKAAAAL